MQAPLIERLLELQKRVQSVRQIPQVLLKPPTAHALLSPTVQPEFSLIKGVAETIRSEPIQDALRTAAESEKADKTDLNLNGRREGRARSRPRSPESPQPYTAPQSNSIPTDDRPALRSEQLAEYILQFNKTHDSRLNIWKPTRTSTDEMLRLTIPDVLTTFMQFSPSDDDVLLIETVAVFGPRERKSPHSQSDYLVFQYLSQQLAKMLYSHPNISLQTFMDLLISYENLFIEQCRSCERVLSSEGHVPPVVRVWNESSWEPRHITCRQT